MVLKLLMIGLFLLYLGGDNEYVIFGIVINYRLALITLLLSGLITLYYKVKFKISRRFLEGIVISTMLLCLIIFFALISPYFRSNYNFIKDMIYSYFIIILTILIMNISLNVSFDISYLIRRFIFIFYFWILVGLLFSIPIIVTFILGYSKPLSFSGPNVTTRLIFFGLSCSIVMYQIFRNKMYIGIAIFFSFIIVLTGSRGGFLSACIVSSLYFLFNKNINIINKSKIFIVVTATIIISMFLIPNVYEFFYNRFVRTTFLNEKIYISGRENLYSLSIDLLKKNNLFLPNTGHFRFLTDWYPHNIFLEVSLDFGFYGLLILGYLLFNSIHCFLIGIKSNLFIGIIPLYMIIAQSASGTYYDFRYYFLWSIITFMYSDKKHLFVNINKSSPNYRKGGENRQGIVGYSPKKAI